MMAIDVGQITDLEAFKGRVDDLFRGVRTSPTAPGYEEIMIPGEPERRKKERLQREGIYVEDETWGKIAGLAGELGVEIPSPMKA